MVRLIKREIIPADFTASVTSALLLPLFRETFGYFVAIHSLQYFEKPLAP